MATALFVRLGALPQLPLRHPPWPIIDLSHQDNIMDTYLGSIAWNATAQVFDTYIYIICVVGSVLSTFLIDPVYPCSCRLSGLHLRRAISAGIARFLVASFAYPLVWIVAIPTSTATCIIAPKDLAALPASGIYYPLRFAPPCRGSPRGFLNFIAGSIMLQLAAERTSMRNNIYILCRVSHEEKSG